MSIRVVRLGSPRVPGEGLRLGTVRRPPRGVPKAAFGSGNWYDVWFPTLAPSVVTLQFARAAESEAEWRRFTQRYRAEMKAPAAEHALALLAALSQETNFSVGCYCEREERCHRAILRELLREHGARVL